MKMTTLIAVLLITFGALSSQAFVLFEPYIGYNKGQEQTSAVQGIGLGVRLGIDLHDFFIAADVDYGDLQMGTLTSVKFTNTGVDFGFRSSNIRMWYGMISGASFAYPSGTATVTTKGTGNKIGLGVMTSSSKLSVNMELKSLSYTSTDAGTGAGATPVTEIATIGFLGVGWVY